MVSTDIAIIPLKPPADDVQVAIETYDLIMGINQTPERMNKPIQYRMVITMSQQNTVIVRHVRNELDQQEYRLLKAEMYHRVSPLLCRAQWSDVSNTDFKRETLALMALF